MSALSFSNQQINQGDIDLGYVSNTAIVNAVEPDGTAVEEPGGSLLPLPRRPEISLGKSRIGSARMF